MSVCVLINLPTRGEDITSLAAFEYMNGKLG